MAATAGQVLTPSSTFSPCSSSSSSSCCCFAAPLTRWLAWAYVRWLSLEARPRHGPWVLLLGVRGPFWVPAFVEALPGCGWSATRTRVSTQMCALGGSFAALMTLPHSHTHTFAYNGGVPHSPETVTRQALAHESLFCN